MLKKLYELQMIEVAEQAIHKERLESSEYRELLEIKTAFAGKKHDCELEQQLLTELEQRINALPEHIAEQEKKLADEQKAMYDGSVTSPKALSAREAQVESIREKLDLLSTEEAELREQRAALDETVKTQNSDLDEMRSRFAELKELYLAAEKEREQRLAVLAGEKAALLPQVEPSLLSWYEAQRHRFNGTPLAILDEQQICGGCHTGVPPIVYKRARNGRDTYCEKCGRRLIVQNEESID